MAKDWTGNSKSVYVQLGASNHTDKEREPNDYYATDPKAVELLCDLITLPEVIWEPACGEGHLVKPLLDRGHKVVATDLVERYSSVLKQDMGGGVDFLSLTKEDELVQELNGDPKGYAIVTNPPFKYAPEFVEKSIELIPNGCMVIMFLKVQFLETKSRRALFEKYPPKYIYVASGRINCAINGDFEALKKTGGNAQAYAWYIWEKGYTGETTLRWFN